MNSKTPMDVAHLTKNSGRSVRFGIALLSLVVLGFSSLAGDMFGHEPRIRSMQFDGTNIVITADVPAGSERVVLEGCRRGDFHAWIPRAIQRTDGPKTMRFVIAASTAAEMEFFRIRAEEHDPLPAGFYSGPTEFSSEPVSSGSVLAGAAGTVTHATMSSTSAAFSASGIEGTLTRAVEESDIWRTRGNRIYFFNSSRGLQILDISSADSPVLRGCLRVSGFGEQMYLLGEHHAILLLGSRCDNGASSFIIVVDVADDRPREIARLPISGQIIESRLVGACLYVAANAWRESTMNGVWEQGVTLSAFDLADPAAPVARPILELSGAGGVVAATDSHLFVTTSDAIRPWWMNTLHVFDIADTNSIARLMAEIPLNGMIHDKFKIHESNDVIAVVTEGLSGTNQVWLSELATYRLSPDARTGAGWTQLGSLALGERERLFATRFDGERVYIVTFQQIDPLWIVDFSAPTNPRIEGELQIPGWSTYIQPLGDRLLAIGLDVTNGTRTAVQLFDVSDAAKPALLSKVLIGDTWSYSEALDNEKALGLFPDEGLVLIPISMTQNNQVIQGIQFVDLAHDALRVRGVFADAQVVPRRTLLRGDRVLAISSRELLTVDYTDRDNPALNHALELSYPVDRVVVMGDWLVEFSGSSVHVSATTNSGMSLRQYALDDLPVLGATSMSNQIHVLQGHGSSGFYPVVNLAIDAGRPVATATGLLQHVTLDASRLPELSFAGMDVIETTNQSWFQGAKALSPQPGLIVWSLTSQSFLPYWFGPVQPFSGGLVLSPATAVSTEFLAPTVTSIRYWPWPAASAPTELLAVDVAGARASHILSETALPASDSLASDAFAAGGLVFRSHANLESEIVGTNIYFYTNRVCVSVTNLVWRTNVAFTPVTISETNVPTSSFVDAVKLRWPGASSGNQFAGGWSHTLGLSGAGTLLAWGDNHAGAIGPGQPLIVPQPTNVPLSTPVGGIAANNWQSFAIDSDGTVWQWGNLDGIMPPSPIPRTNDYSALQSVSMPSAISKIAAGGWHALALASDGRLWTWGPNYRGELGTGNYDPATEPQLVPGNFTAVAAGWLHSLAIGSNGQVFSWGWNDDGELGRGGTSETPGPVELPDNVTIREIAAGVLHSLALASNGVVWGWGDNSYGELGGSDARSAVPPLPVAGLPPIRQIASGAGHSVALAENGQVWMFGQDPVTEQQVFVRIESLTNVVAVGAGAWHSLALTADGNLFVWGYDLPLIGGSGESVKLPVVNFVPVIRSVTNHIAVTNVFSEEQETQRWEDQIVTNSYPAYRYSYRHFLDVVDYGQDAEMPVMRAPASLPGTLQGVSENGLFLYTLNTDFGDASGTIPQARFSALAYDGLAAHLVNTVTLSTNSNEQPVQMAVRDDGIIAVGHDNWIVGSVSRIECWRLEDSGQIGLLGACDSPTRIFSLRMLDDLLTVRSENGVGIVDLANPAAPSALPTTDQAQCIWADLNKLSGDRQAGVWLPAGDLGTLPVWSP